MCKTSEAPNEMLRPPKRKKSSSIGCISAYISIKSAHTPDLAPETLVHYIILDQYGIQHIYTVLYCRLLLGLVRFWSRRRDNKLSSINCALRSAKHVSIGTPPKHDVFGQSIVLHRSTQACLSRGRGARAHITSKRNRGVGLQPVISTSSS